MERMIVEKVSVCICTRNRVDDLKRAIESVYQSSYSNIEVIVSDDSTNEESERMIESNFFNVKYVKGPRKGLCFNRNNALKLVEGTRILFMDDDVIMSPDFLQIVDNRLLKFDKETRKKMVITGIERNNGNLVYPNNIDFLGHQRKPYKQNETLKTIVINSTIFPVGLFEIMNFDEQLVYGYDEVDIAARAVFNGYKIVMCEQAINDHFPSEVNRNYYNSYKEASRIYVTFKRYKHLEKKHIKSTIYIIYSSLHTIIYETKRNKLKAYINIAGTLRKAFTYIRLSGRFSV